MLCLDRVRSIKIRDRDDVARGAMAFKSAVEEIAPLRIGASADIAARRTMLDAEGRVLAVEVFGWIDKKLQWWTKENFSLGSPLSAASRYECEPFWANAKGFHTSHPNRYLDAIDLTAFEERAMTKAAIVVPVHLPFGKIGVVCFNTTTDVDDLSDIFSEFSEILALYARTFITSYIAAVGSSDGVPPKCSLSLREVECLEWAAIGKTDDEIASILSRSRATVRFHFQNASVKLNSVNRSQSVFKAAQLGFVSTNRRRDFAKQ
jgi:LuxR family quorum-sensing system transcriptional regulator CciR